MGPWSDERERALSRLPVCNGAIVLRCASAGNPVAHGDRAESRRDHRLISLQRPARRSIMVPTTMSERTLFRGLFDTLIRAAMVAALVAACYEVFRPFLS